MKWHIMWVSKTSDWFFCPSAAKEPVVMSMSSLLVSLPW